jgi:(aminoalkyl)phosphonate N-acetyltransferase
MNIDLEIREVQPKDEEEVRLLLDELEQRVADPSIFQTIFKEYLHRTEAVFLVAEVDRKVIGFISCLGQRLLHHEGWVYEIQELIITEIFQGKKIGQALMEEVRRRLEPRGIKSIEVCSNKRRKKAHAFYQAVGFANSHEKFTIYF